MKKILELLILTELEVDKEVDINSIQTLKNYSQQISNLKCTNLELVYDLAQNKRVSFKDKKVILNEELSQFEKVMIDTLAIKYNLKAKSDFKLYKKELKVLQCLAQEHALVGCTEDRLNRILSRRDFTSVEALRKLVLLDYVHCDLELDGTFSIYVTDNGYLVFNRYRELNKQKPMCICKDAVVCTSDNEIYIDELEKYRTDRKNIKALEEKVIELTQKYNALKNNLFKDNVGGI